MSDKLFEQIEIARSVNDATKFIGPCWCDSSVGHICETCYTHGVLGDCKREIERLRAELAAAKAASVVPVKWQPMDTAPKDGTVILLATTVRVAESSWGVCRPQFDGYVANNGEPCWRASCEQKIRGGFPLYWMPMPPYPSQDNPPPAT